jgi:hypothetical protein
MCFTVVFYVHSLSCLIINLRIVMFCVFVVLINPVYLIRFASSHISVSPSMEFFKIMTAVNGDGLLILLCHAMLHKAQE